MFSVCIQAIRNIHTGKMKNTTPTHLTYLTLLFLPPIFYLLYAAHELVIQLTPRVKGCTVEGYFLSNRESSQRPCVIIYYLLILLL